MMASSKNQGHYFLVMMLNIEVDHYFFLILHLGTKSISMAHLLYKEPSKL